MTISLIVNRQHLSNPRVQKLLNDLDDPNMEYVRVPGTSKSGICSFCAQFVFMRHDGSGDEVPLPVSGTHLRCVCSDIPVPVFDIGTKASLADAYNMPEEAGIGGYVFKIRAARKGATGRFDWLKYQKKSTLARIMGTTRAGYLNELPIEDTYNKQTMRPRKLTSLQRMVKKRGK